LVEEMKQFYNIETFSLGTTKFLGLIKNTISLNEENTKWRHIDIRYIDPDSFPYCWLYYSSGKVFNKLIREKLKKKGYKLNEWGLFKDDRKINLGIQNISNETDIKRLSKKSLCSIKHSNDDLIEYTEKIEKEIFKIAGLEYITVRQRY
jgi:DNA polymerase/3'-5' exonuclease PolX